MNREKYLELKSKIEESGLTPLLIVKESMLILLFLSGKKKTQ